MHSSARGAGVALLLIRGSRPALVLLDLVLPRMNTWQFAEVYR